MGTKERARVSNKTLDQLERELKRASDTDRRNTEKQRASYDLKVSLMRTASEQGLSYDRIAAATGLSKTQISRVLRG